MASEAGVLGVPWVFIYTKRLCYLDDQEKNYGLGYTVSDSKEALKIALNLLANPDLKKEWSEKRKKLLNDKIDVSHFMTELIKGLSRKSWISTECRIKIGVIWENALGTCRKDGR